jgi:hypothetical protein
MWISSAGRIRFTGGGLNFVESVTERAFLMTYLKNLNDIDRGRKQRGILKGNSNILRFFKGINIMNIQWRKGYYAGQIDVKKLKRQPSIL